MHEKLKKQLRQSRLSKSSPPTVEEWQRFLNQIDEDYAEDASDNHIAVLRRRLDETMLLNRVIAAATSSYRTNTILQIICREFVQAFDLARSTAAIFNGNQTELTIVAEHIRDEGEQSTLGNKIPLANNPSTLHILRTRQSLVSNNVLEDERLVATRHISEKNGTRAMILLPLLVRDQIIGTIGLNATELRTFTEEEQQLANSAAAATSQALDNAKLYEALQRKLRDQERADRLLRHQYAYLGALQETMLSLTNSLNLDVLMQDIVARAGVLLNSKHGFLYLRNHITDQFDLKAGCGAFEFSVGKTIVLDKGLGGATLKSQKMVIVRDYHKRYGTTETESRMYGAAAIPLRSSDGILGILGFAHLAEDRIFNEQEISVFENFAQFASLALDNAILHTAAMETMAQHVARGSGGLDKKESEGSRFWQQVGQALQAPLKGMITHSHSLVIEAGSQTPPTDGRWQQELAALRDSGIGLSHRINDILELNKIESGSIQLQLERVSIKTLINDSYQAVQPLIKQHNNVFAAQLSPDLAMLYLDPAKTVRILKDVLRSAAMMTRDGKIHLRAKSVVWQDMPYIAIEVEDTAQGVSSKQMAHSLGGEHPLPSAKKRAANGDRFGLVFSRLYCQLMGGDIEAQVSATHGTLVTIYLAANLSNAIDETI